MIEFHEALNLMMVQAVATEPEMVPLSDSLNRILAADVVSDIDMPRFNRSTMDGYAIKSADIGNTLEIMGVLAAGQTDSVEITAGQALRIMTGAKVPESADMVVPIELCQHIGANQVAFEPNKKTNISYKAEDFKTGETVVKKGQRIHPQHVGILATVGRSSVSVNKKPVVGIITSGNELVAADVKPTGSQVRNSNGPLLEAICRQAMVEIINFGIIHDEMSEASAIISKSLSECDVLLVSGGISTGDFDLIPKIIDLQGGKIIFQKVNIQPGKPFLMAKMQNKPVFGIPGNPVATFITAHLFVVPFLNRMMGYDQPTLEMVLPISDDFMRSGNSRKTFIPVKITPSGTVDIIHYNGSGHLQSYSEANAIAIIEPMQTQILKGEPIRVRLL